jgi:hypothetical protein
MRLNGAAMDNSDRVARRLDLLGSVSFSQEDLQSILAEMEELERVVADLEEFSRETPWISLQAQPVRDKDR